MFERIADLLEIDGADAFRINSYRRASRTLKETSADIAALAAEGRLTELQAIGKGTAGRIEQFIDTGRIDVLTELEEKLPEGLPALLEIPGLGPKKLALMHGKLGVAGLDDLKEVIDSGTLAALPGLGPTSVKKIAEGIAFLQRSGERTPLGIALPIAEMLAAKVASLKGVKRVEIAGSLRRGKETVGDIDILCDAADGKAVIKDFVAFTGVKRVLAAGATKGSITVELPRARELQVDLRVVPGESFGAALQYFTGSKEHNVRLRELAVRRKWRLSEYGLFDGEKLLTGRREQDIYKKLGLPDIPPQLREDRGEFDSGWHGRAVGQRSSSPSDRGDDAGAGITELVTLEDIRGDLHVHTDASDGRFSIEQMAQAAKQRGYEYIAVCDHSKSSAIANGLSIKRMEKHIEAIRSADRKLRGFTIIVGCECDILRDGSLDYPDELLAECDFVVASIHSGMTWSRDRRGAGKPSPTERTLAAMENKYVSAIGHPTGRLIGQRPPMELDMGAVVEAAARTGTMLEINANWQRLDLKDLHIRQALDAGVLLVMATDAHHTEQYDQMRYGVMTARRGGATKGDVVNTLSPTLLRKRIAAKRR